MDFTHAARESAASSSPRLHRVTSTCYRRQHGLSVSSGTEKRNQQGAADQGERAANGAQTKHLQVKQEKTESSSSTSKVLQTPKLKLDFIWKHHVLGKVTFLPFKIKDDLKKTNMYS